MANDVQVIRRVKTSHHRMVRSRICLHLGKKRIRMLKRKTGRKVEEFRLSLENKFSVFNKSNDLDTATSRFTNAVNKSSVGVGGKQPKVYKSKALAEN